MGVTKKIQRLAIFVTSLARKTLKQAVPEKGNNNITKG